MSTDSSGSFNNVDDTTKIIHKNQYILKSPIGKILVENEITPNLHTSSQQQISQENDTFPLQSQQSTSTPLYSSRKAFKRNYHTTMTDIGIFYVG